MGARSRAGHIVVLTVACVGSFMTFVDSAGVLIAGRLVEAAAAAVLVSASLSLSLLSAPQGRRATTFSTWVAAAARPTSEVSP
jgi:hypothetical protein